MSFFDKILGTFVNAKGIEKNLMGDPHFLEDIQKQGSFGLKQYGEGDALSDDALAGFADLDKGYSNRLRSGNVLDPSVAKAYSSLRGGIRDRGAGDRTAARAAVAQQIAQSGGRLSPEQQAALLAAADENIGQQEFEQFSNVGVQESRDTLAAVNDLNDRIERARGVRLQAGQFKMGMGAKNYADSILNRLGRNKSIAETASPFG